MGEVNHPSCRSTKIDSNHSFPRGRRQACTVSALFYIDSASNRSSPVERCRTRRPLLQYRYWPRASATSSFMDKLWTCSEKEVSLEAYHEEATDTVVDAGAAGCVCRM